MSVASILYYGSCSESRLTSHSTTVLPRGDKASNVSTHHISIAHSKREWKRSRIASIACFFGAGILCGTRFSFKSLQPSSCPRVLQSEDQTLLKNALPLQLEPDTFFCSVSHVGTLDISIALSTSERGNASLSYTGSALFGIRYRFKSFRHISYLVKIWKPLLKDPYLKARTRKPFKPILSNIKVLNFLRCFI